MSEKSYTAYCLKEKIKHDMKDVEVKKTKNGRNYVSGSCSSCGCKMNVFLKSDKSKIAEKVQELVKE